MLLIMTYTCNLPSLSACQCFSVANALRRVCIAEVPTMGKSGENIKGAMPENLSSRFPTRSHTNQALQPQKMARG